MDDFGFKEENRDLYNYQLIRTIFKLGGTALWIILGALGLKHYIDDPLSVDLLDNIPMLVLIIVLYCAVPIVFLKPYELLTNANWTGTVGKKFKSTKMVSVQGRRMPVQKDVLEMDITRDSDGKVFRYEFIDDRYFLGIDYYKTGDKVRHRTNFKYPEKVRQPDEKYCICIVCGYLSDPRYDECPICKHSLLK